MFVKKRVAIPGKKVKNDKGKEERVKTEVEVLAVASVAEGVNVSGGEDSLTAYLNQCIAQDAAAEFGLAFKEAVKNGKSETEAIVIGRDAAKKVKIAVRGPSKKEIDAQKDADIKELLSGKISDVRRKELASKYGV